MSQQQRRRTEPLPPAATAADAPGPFAEPARRQVRVIAGAVYELRRGTPGSEEGGVSRGPGSDSEGSVNFGA